MVWFRIIITFVCLFITVACNRSEQYYIQRGNAFLEQSKPNDAAIQYRKAVQKNSKSGEAYYRLGIAEVRLGNAVEALNALSLAVRLSPLPTPML